MPSALATRLSAGKCPRAVAMASTTVATELVSSVAAVPLFVSLLLQNRRHSSPLTISRTIPVLEFKSFERDPSLLSTFV